MSVLAPRSALAVSDFEFAILGAGAMDSILGAHPALAGHSVAMLARGTRATHLEHNGLTIKGLTEFTTPAQTLRNPTALRSAGVLIVATKTPGTGAALDQLRHAGSGSRCPFRTAPSNTSCSLRPSARSGYSAHWPSTRAPAWKYLSDPDAALLVARVVREMGVLARALGIGLSDHAVFPVASICSGEEREAAAMVVKAGKMIAPGHRISALQDVEAGRPLEVNETLGYAYDQARALGLSLPLLEVFRRLVTAIDRTRR